MNIKVFHSILFRAVICIFFFCASSCDRSQNPTVTSPDQIKTKTTSCDTPFDVKLRIPSAPKGLSPYHTTSAVSGTICEQIFLTMLHIDPITLKFAPVLGELPQIEFPSEGPYADGSIYHYEIHEEAVWDNGSPVLASDVAFTIKAVLNPFSDTHIYKSHFDFISELKIDPENPKKYTIYCKQRHIHGTAMTGGIYIHPEYIYDPEKLMRKYTVKELANAATKEKYSADEDIKKFAKSYNAPKHQFDNDFISGCGAYKIDRNDDSNVTLVKKDNWWGDKISNEFPLLTACPNRLVYKIIQDPISAATAFRDGQFDVYNGMPAEEFIALRDSELGKNKFTFHNPELLQSYYCGFNMKSKKLNDDKTRKAIAHIIDVNEIIEDIALGFGTRVIGPIHPSKSYYNKAIPLLKKNTDKAKKLLEQAGWKDDDGNGILEKLLNNKKIELSLDFLYPSPSSIANPIALLLQDAARKVGIKINPIANEFNIFLDKLKNKDFEIILLGIQSQPVLDDLYNRWHTDNCESPGKNATCFGNQESDELIKKISITFDETERNKMYLRLQEIINESQPGVFLFAPTERIAISKKFDENSLKISTRRPGFFENHFKTVSQ